MTDTGRTKLAITGDTSRLRADLQRTERRVREHAIRQARALVPVLRLMIQAWAEAREQARRQAAALHVFALQFQDKPHSIVTGYDGVTGVVER